MQAKTTFPRLTSLLRSRACCAYAWPGWCIRPGETQNRVHRSTPAGSKARRVAVAAWYRRRPGSCNSRLGRALCLAVFPLWRRSCRQPRNEVRIGLVGLEPAVAGVQHRARGASPVVSDAIKVHHFCGPGIELARVSKCRRLCRSAQSHCCNHAESRRARGCHPATATRRA